MICPKCKAEYVQGITVCADCDVPLVDKLPERDTGEDIQETGQNEVGFAEIFVTFDATEIALVKSILDGAGIDYYIKSEHFTFSRPFEDPARLHIREDQLDEALDILKDLDFGTWGNLNEESGQAG